MVGTRNRCTGVLRKMTRDIKLMSKKEIDGLNAKLTPSGNVHPVAALFPMMTEEELQELAEDIKTNGLLNPIVLDDEGTLIDGRNRLEGCKRAKVSPTYIALNGIDPVVFIMSSNDKRRHMKLGQRAMIAA